MIVTAQAEQNSAKGLQDSLGESQSRIDPFY